MERWVSIGRIGRAKGLRGEVRVEVYNPDSRLLEEIRSVSAGTGPADLVPLSILGISRQTKSWVVSFRGVETRDGASRLTGRELFVRRADLPELPPGEHYCCDLIGFRVVSESGEEFGTLRNVLPTASNDIYEVDGPRGEMLFPAIPDVVVRIDETEGRIVVRPPEVTDAV